MVEKEAELLMFIAASGELGLTNTSNKKGYPTLY